MPQIDFFAVRADLEALVHFFYDNGWVLAERFSRGWQGVTQDNRARLFTTAQDMMAQSGFGHPQQGNTDFCHYVAANLKIGSVLHHTLEFGPDKHTFASLPDDLTDPFDPASLGAQRNGYSGTGIFWIRFGGLRNGTVTESDISSFGGKSLKEYSSPTLDTKALAAFERRLRSFMLKPAGGKKAFGRYFMGQALAQATADTRFGTRYNDHVGGYYHIGSDGEILLTEISPSS